MKERISIKAVIDFTFNTDPDYTRDEMIEEIIDRIRSGDYFPSDVVGLELIPA